MKYKIFKHIVEEYADSLSLSAAYSGSWGDGGYEYYMNKLYDYTRRFIIKYDLRPSETYKLDDIDVGEPHEFKKIIDEYKLNLIDKIKLN